MSDHPIRDRDLADFSATAGDIALVLKHAGCALGRAYEDGDPMPVDVLPDLRQAAANLAALIVDAEGAAS